MCRGWGQRQLSCHCCSRSPGARSLGPSGIGAVGLLLQGRGQRRPPARRKDKGKKEKMKHKAAGAPLVRQYFAHGRPASPDLQRMQV